jgi:Glycosyl transferase family 2
MELSIVMPCLNEAKTLPACIKKAQRFLRESGVEGEVIVADNGSTDGSLQIAEELGARVVNVPLKGYGAALSVGIFEAKGMFVIMGDSDDSYDFLGLQPFVDKLREGYDLVMGNRFLGGISKGAMPFMHRYVGNPMLSALGRRIYGNVVCHDFYCGLRGFRKDAIMRLGVQSTGMEFALEMIIKSELYQLKITEVPTTLSPDGRGRKPHLSTYRDGWRSLRLYLLMSPRWTFGIPGIILAMLGLISLAAAILGLVPPGWEGVAHIFSTVAAAIGYQAILLAVFAKFVAIESGLHPPATKFYFLQNRSALEGFVFFGFLLSFVCAILAMVMRARFPSIDSDIFSSQLEAFLEIGLIIGGQTVLAGFYFGLLHLLRERRLFPRKRYSD